MFLKLCLVVHKNTIKHNPTFKLVNSTKSFEHSQRFVEHAVQYQHIRTMRLSTDFWSIKMKKKIKNRFFYQIIIRPAGSCPEHSMKERKSVPNPYPPLGFALRDP